MKKINCVITGRIGRLQVILDDIVHRPQGISHRGTLAILAYLSRYKVAELRQICSVGSSRADMIRDIVYSIHRRRGYAILGGQI